MSKVAIEVTKLSKKYSSSASYAVRDLSLRIQPGETYGFLGPNGAGKSTTIRLLMNFIQPTSGSAKILGLDVVEDSVPIKSRIGYLPGEVSFYRKMTGEGFLAYMSQLKGHDQPKQLKELVKKFDFNLKPKISDLSKGNRQKLGIIQAFMHQPEVLVLDEPTSGLDPLMQEVFFELVRASKARGATLFISSHNLSEVQKICDRVGFIREGRLIAEQDIKDFSKQAIQIYDITFDSDVPLSSLKKIKSTNVVVNSPRHATVRVKGDLSALLLVLARHQVHSIDRRESALEEEFLRFYKEQQK